MAEAVTTNKAASVYDPDGQYRRCGSGRLWVDGSVECTCPVEGVGQPV